MSQIIFQPISAHTKDHRNGTVTVQAPKASTTGWYNNDNIKINTTPRTFSGVDTGVFNAAYSGRWDDNTYYTA